MSNETESPAWKNRLDFITSVAERACITGYTVAPSDYGQLRVTVTFGPFTVDDADWMAKNNAERLAAVRELAEIAAEKGNPINLELSFDFPPCPTDLDQLREIVERMSREERPPEPLSTPCE